MASPGYATRRDVPPSGALLGIASISMSLFELPLGGAMARRARRCTSSHSIASSSSKFACDARRVRARRTRAVYRAASHCIEFSKVLRGEALAAKLCLARRRTAPALSERRRDR